MPRIADYALLSNCQGSALVSRDSAACFTVFSVSPGFVTPEHRRTERVATRVRQGSVGLDVEIAVRPQGLGRVRDLAQV
jgi:hypothetical protein